MEFISDIDLVKAFVNTYNVEAAHDVSGSPAQLEDWLARHAVTEADAVATPAALAAWFGERGVTVGNITPEDVERARTVREALRAVLLANNGGPDASDAYATLADAGRTALLRVGFDEDGTVRLEPGAPGIDAAIGQLLAAVARIQTGGDWPRFKACAAGDCHWAYFDESRNRSRTWCSMEVCGNRAKARTYRKRGS